MMTKLLQIVFVCGIAAQICIAQNNASIETRPKRFSNDGLEYIGLTVNMPTRPDAESAFDAPTCLRDLLGSEFFGRQVRQGRLTVVVFGFFSTDNQRLCGDLSNTGLANLVSVIRDGQITVNLASTPNMKKIVVSKTARTPSGVFVERHLIYVSRDRIWMIRVDYPENDVQARAAANRIMTENSIQTEIERP